MSENKLNPVVIVRRVGDAVILNAHKRNIKKSRDLRNLSQSLPKAEERSSKSHSRTHSQQSQSHSKTQTQSKSRDRQHHHHHSTLLTETMEITQIHKILNIDVSDDKFNERRVIALKSMLKMREQENLQMRQMMNKKDLVFRKTSELCAFFTQILAKEYIDKQNDPDRSGLPLGAQLLKKDTRRFQISMPWHQIIEDVATNNVERKILTEMALQMSLPVLAKSPLDVMIVRRQIVQRMCSEDETFARHYFLSMLKEIKALNKEQKEYFAYHQKNQETQEKLEKELAFKSQQLLVQALPLPPNNINQHNSSFTNVNQSTHNVQRQSSSNSNLQHRPSTSNQLTPAAHNFFNQYNNFTQANNQGQQIPEKQFENFNYDVMMRIESQLYHLFRALVKFLKNENFIEYYQCLLTLKDAVRESLETILDFSLVLAKNDKFASNKLQKEYSSHMSENFKKLGSALQFKDQNEEPILREIHNQIKLSNDKIQDIVQNSNPQNFDYLYQSLNDMRMNEIKMQTKIKALQSELDLWKNSHNQIDKRLNKVEDKTREIFERIQKKLNQNVFEPLRDVQQLVGLKGTANEIQGILEQIFKAEKKLFDSNDKDAHDIDLFKQGQKQALDYIEKLNNYLIHFDKMFKEICDPNNTLSKGYQ